MNSSSQVEISTYKVVSGIQLHGYVTKQQCTLHTYRSVISQPHNILCNRTCWGKKLNSNKWPDKHLVKCSISLPDNILCNGIQQAKHVAAFL